jgi:hypothetical protein
VSEFSNYSFCNFGDTNLHAKTCPKCDSNSDADPNWRVQHFSLQFSKKSVYIFITYKPKKKKKIALSMKCLEYSGHYDKITKEIRRLCAGLVTMKI